MSIMGRMGDPQHAPAWSYESDQGGAILGTAVAGAGDVNGDDVSDLIAGMPGYGGELEDAGATILFFGSASGLATSPDWTAEGEQTGVDFGGAVAVAGDVDHDGWDEVVVGRAESGCQRARDPGRKGLSLLWLG